MGANDFITKDSGERKQFESGMQRDTDTGKPRFDLMFPLNVPYDEQMLVRLAALYGRGAEKYEDRNWEQANSEEEMARMKASAFRHFMQWFCGEKDEDHAAGAMFNIIAFETTEYKVERDAKPECARDGSSVCPAAPCCDCLNEVEIPRRHSGTWGHGCSGCESEDGCTFATGPSVTPA